jgi:hypothetical protein
LERNSQLELIALGTNRSIVNTQLILLIDGQQIPIRPGSFALSLGMMKQGHAEPLLSSTHDECEKMQEVVVKLRETAKIAVSYSQKSHIVQILAVIDANPDGGITAEQLEKVDSILNVIRDGMLQQLSTIGIVAALFGISTFGNLLNPLTPSTMDPPSELFEHDYRKKLFLGYTLATLASTCLTLVVIFLVTVYSLILSIMLPTREDLVHFIVDVPAVFVCTMLLVVGVFLAIIALSLSFFLLYSVQTAYIGVGVTASALISFAFLSLKVLLTVFRRIDSHLEVHL